MTKKKTKKKTTLKKKKKPNKVLTYITFILLSILVLIASFIGGYSYGYEDAKDEITKKHNLEKKKRLSALKKLEKTSIIKHKKSVNTRLKEVLKKATKEDIVASHEYDTKKYVKPPKPSKRAFKTTTNKPKLAIIIDDVSTKRHIRNIKKVGITLTMSFLPPSKARPNSAKLASHENIYMVHLPMEAFNFHAEEDITLRVSDSASRINAIVKHIKEIFPRVKYLNNHTGSKFTANEVAMNKLIYALKAQRINFVDSRTTGKTKAKKVIQNFGLKYRARDVFLDHKSDKASIKQAIKQAIRIAKLHGTAIAIGHPHANTLKALYESRALFKDVELVYINRLY
ncbi:MAG: divergent polysaccharide deacetylase family protein [Epsilonproteobacteria bacterium]|nr:divergent polysaccharide deacetylase family protein [Campylobacterota bacterium]